MIRDISIKLTFYNTYVLLPQTQTLPSNTTNTTTVFHQLIAGGDYDVTLTLVTSGVDGPPVTRIVSTRK